MVDSATPVVSGQPIMGRGSDGKAYFVSVDPVTGNLITQLTATPTIDIGDVELKAGAAVVGNVGGITRSVTVVPTIAGTTYGINYSVGGILTFANLFNASGSGMLQSVSLNSKKVNTNQLWFVPFASLPANAIADNAAAAINVADFATVRAPIPLTNSSILGTHTNSSAYGLGLPWVTGGTSAWGIIIAGAAFTSALAAGDLSLTVKVLPDA